MTKIEDELSRRAAMWAATMRDDAASLREKARTTTDRTFRGGLLRLARALNRAAKILDVEAGYSSRPRPAKAAKTARTSTPRRGARSPR